ncbi:hypothetical protein AFLA_007471 [Aspergillus flavus NRRL3357]|nr:hypothetical protein AFLA_007471 [Aspergillus flavus NRRL3357]
MGNHALRMFFHLHVLVEPGRRLSSDANTCRIYLKWVTGATTLCRIFYTRKCFEHQNYIHFKLRVPILLGWR